MEQALVWNDTATRVMKKALCSYGVTEDQFNGIWSDLLKDRMYLTGGLNYLPTYNLPR